MTTKRRQIGDIVVLKKIGSGSFASVWKGYNNKTRVNVAVKSVNREKINLNKKHQENLESEIAIMKKLQHTNIVGLFDIQYTKKHIYLILEYCGGGDLSKLIRTRGPFSETIARRLLKQLAAGLQFLRSHNLIHRDLKPQNLLVDTEKIGSAILKIADFGFARYIQPSSMAATLCGSPLYMAPEILRYQKYDAKADLWSVGTILYEMLCGKPPFTGQNHVQLLERIQTTEVSFPSNIDLSEACKSMILGLLKRNPKDRMDFPEFFSHPFLLSGDEEIEIDLKTLSLGVEQTSESKGEEREGEGESKSKVLPNNDQNTTTDEKPLQTSESATKRQQQESPGNRSSISELEPKESETKGKIPSERISTSNSPLRNPLPSQEGSPRYIPPSSAPPATRSFLNKDEPTNNSPILRSRSPLSMASPLIGSQPQEPPEFIRKSSPQMKPVTTRSPTLSVPSSTLAPPLSRGGQSLSRLPPPMLSAKESRSSRDGASNSRDDDGFVFIDEYQDISPSIRPKSQGSPHLEGQTDISRGSRSKQLREEELGLDRPYATWLSSSPSSARGLGEPPDLPPTHARSSRDVQDEEPAFLPPPVTTRSPSRSQGLYPTESRMEKSRGGIGSGVDTFKESPSIGQRPMAHLNDHEALEEFYALGGRASTIAFCGDLPDILAGTSSMSTVTSSDDSTGLTPVLSRLTLYLKALSLFETAITTVNRYKSEISIQKTSLFSNRTSAQTLSKLDSLLDWLVEQFQLYYKKADKQRKYTQDTLGVASSGDEDPDGGSGDDLEDELELLKGKRRRGGKVFTPERVNSLPHVNIPSAEKLIYEWAMKWAKDAAIEEMMSNSKAALSHYRRSLRLFEQLTVEQVDQHDAMILQTVIGDIQTRIDALQQSHT